MIARRAERTLWKSALARQVVTLLLIRASSGSDSNRDLGLLIPNQIYIIESKPLGLSPRRRVSTAALRTARIAGQGLPGLPGCQGLRRVQSSQILPKPPACDRALLSSRAQAKTWDPFHRTRMLAYKRMSALVSPLGSSSAYPWKDRPF